MSTQPILPEAITDPKAFQEGFIYGEQLATNDLAAHRAITDEALNALLPRLEVVHAAMPTDWWAGMLAGYRVRRAL